MLPQFIKLACVADVILPHDLVSSAAQASYKLAQNRLWSCIS